MAIDPTRWYWVVQSGDRAGQVFSGADAAYVDAEDAGYVAFLEGGNVATPILSDGELADVLAQRGVPGSTIAAAGWTDWGNVPAGDVERVLLAAGVEVTSTSNAETSGRYSCEPTRQTLITGESLYIQTTGGPETGHFSNGQQVRGWRDVDGVPHPFTTVQFIEFAQRVTEYVDAVVTYVVSGMAGDPPDPAVTVS